MAGVDERCLTSSYMNRSFPISQATEHSGALPRARVVLIYDSFATAVRGKAFCEQLGGPLRVRCKLEESLWRSDLLNIPAIRQEAARAALSADFVVIALNGSEEFPHGLDRWFGEWMPHTAGRDITLVLLFDPATAQRGATEHIRTYLRKAAFAAGVHFFAHTTVRPTDTEFTPADEVFDRSDELEATALLEQPSDISNGDQPRILVVDDYPSVCDMISRALKSRGFSTLIAHNGEEARRIVMANPGIDLVITDIAMPRMRGDDLAFWLMREYPATRVLLMPSACIPHSLATFGLPLLKKPFGKEALLAAVDDIFSAAECAGERI